MKDPLLMKDSELIIEDDIQANNELLSKMTDDISLITEETKNSILLAMLKMHKYLDDYCGDLDVSLNTTKEIKENTQPWYIIFDGSSNMERRAIRFHYKCNWETGHGVEVIVLNGNKAVFVGNCGYASSIERLMSTDNSEYNYL